MEAVPTPAEQKEHLKQYIEKERDLKFTSNRAKRGATEGPLRDLIPVFIDFETWMSDTVKLGSMTLRQYLDATHLTAMSLAIGYDEPEAYLIPNGIFMPEDEWLLLTLEELAQDPKYVFVAHNAAFDMRVLRFLVGTSWPENIFCTMEGAMGAWPELPGGYTLANICKRLNFAESLRKLHIDLLKCTDAELLEYNKRDVRAMQELYAREIALLPGLEQEVAIRTNRQRQFYFRVGQERLIKLMSELKNQIDVAEKEAGQYVTDPEDIGEIFNREDGQLRSVRSARLLKIINEKMGGDFTSTSLKKISPLKLAQHQRVAQLLAQTSTANKLMSHWRRSKVFNNVDEVDIELGYMRAHTGRFSSPSMGGRGLNLHNIPKHNILIAKPIRSVFRLPDDKCFVRADLANVEYRCIAEDTKIPTSTGIKRIQDVLCTDLVWDGVEWVSHTGVICRGRKEVICCLGIWATEDHLFLTEDGWQEARHIVSRNIIEAGVVQDNGLNLLDVSKMFSIHSALVYDITNSGPRHRFQAGNVIVHNCEGKLFGCKTVEKMFDPALGGDVFVDPYSAAWAQMTGQKINKKDPIRQVAKAAVLGLGFCLAKDTPVVTPDGIKFIQDISSEDKVWNGRKWVRVSGVLKTGRKQCIRLGNTWLTENHRVWWNGWHTAGEIASSVAMLIQQKVNDTDVGSSRQKSSMSVQNDDLKFDAIVAMNHLFGPINCHEVKASNVESVLIHGVDNGAEHPENTKRSLQIRDFADGGLQPITMPKSDVSTQLTLTMQTMADGVLNLYSRSKNGLTMLNPYPDGMTGLCFWTGLTTTETTKLEISNSSRLPLLSRTGELIKEDLEVYDITDVEEGNRFQAGDWLVHNCMGPTGYARQSLLTALADKKSGVTEDVLHTIARNLDWKVPTNDGVKRVMTALGCSQIVALCSYHIHRVFNQAHPEFSMTGDWLVAVVNAVAATFSPEQGREVIKRAYESTRAPDPKMIQLEIDDDFTFERNSIRVCCGPWPRTVCWRNPKVRPTTFQDGASDRKLTILKSTGEFKPFTRQLATENVTQAAARNGLCWAVAELEKRGFPNVLHVHDEILIITDRNPRAVLAAKNAMIDVVGPKSNHPLGWAVLVKPDEINVSESMWEAEEPERWIKIEKGEPGCLDNLT